MLKPHELEQIVTSAQFIPTNRQIHARTEFHQRNAGMIPDSLDASQAVRMGAPAALERWWTTPGFPAWWISLQWESQESHRLLLQAMSRVSELLRDSENPTVVIAAAKEARELYTKLMASNEQKFADAEIGNMPREQLAEYIRLKSAAITGNK